jgi:AcrR family transcriptional regulator
MEASKKLMDSRPKRLEQGDATRDALVASARDRFGRLGYAATSLEEIVRSAGVTQGALYHHFRGKQDLFRCVFEAVKRELSREAFPIDLASDDAWGDLVWGCRSFIEKHADPSVQRIVLIDARSVLSWDDWHKVESEYGVVLLRGTLRRLVHRGIIEPQPLNSLAMILGGALSQACMLVTNTEDHAGAIDEAMAIIERLLEGLRPRMTSGASSSS